MCLPKRTIPTNQVGQATRLWLCHCQSIQIRTFHITWFTFWLCFLGWFATANLFPQIQSDLGLTHVHKAIAGGCSVASTVLFRVIVGDLCDSVGPRKTYPALLIITTLTIGSMALVTGPIGYIISSLFLGVAGASFVITQYHTTAMFSGKTVGTANATSAGWGNFGGGCANFFMPLLYHHFRDSYGVSNSTAWRLCMVVPAVAYIAMAFVYYTFTQDRPFVAKKTDNHVKGSVFKIGASDYRTWILFLAYAACFGIELTVLRFTVGYLMTHFGLEQQFAGFIILCFSLCNLFARSIGGVVADTASRVSKESLHGRVYSLFVMLFVEGVCLVLFAFGADETWIDSLGYTIAMLIAFSLCVQAAEGATFAIVPFVQPKAIGAVAGIVGAGGVVGATVFALCIFTAVHSSITYLTAWLMLGVFVLVVSFCTLGIRFTEEEIRTADKTMNAWIEMDTASAGGNQKNKNELEMHLDFDEQSHLVFSS
eukprot:647860_1